VTNQILLVHGAFHSGDCWERLIPKLAELSFEARAVTLSGHRGNPKWPWWVTMKTYGSDVIAAAEAIGQPCLLLGHSMGGMVISEAAQRRRDLFTGLIYLTAFVPKFGKSSPPGLAPVSPLMRSASEASLGGTMTVSADVAKRVFYNRCAREAQNRAVELLCPQPIRAAMGSIETTADGLGLVQKHYIECTDDEALPIASQRAMQANMPFDSVETLDSDHSPFFSQPNALASAISRAAGRRRCTRQENHSIQTPPIAQGG